MVIELKYANTNTYLIKGSKKYILFDTGCAGTFDLFCKSLERLHIKAQDIEYLLISHFHADHMGIAQEIANLGITIVVLDVQKDFIHNSDGIFANGKRNTIDDTKIRIISTEESRQFLAGLGIEGEILHTPGHSEDSISIWLEEGALLVGDLNPLYELPMQKGTQIGDIWEMLLKYGPRKIYYGHSKMTILHKGGNLIEQAETEDKERYRLVNSIMKYIDKGYGIDKIQKKTRADRIFVEDVMRMYLTHQNIGVQGILDRIEIKNI